MTTLKLQEVESKIIEIRNQQVILDSDVAVLYGVETKRVNEAVKNNPEKFPEGYIITLTQGEKREVVENFDHLSYLKFSSVLPKAFTESGLYMLATILKSSVATQTTITIIDTFTKIKELSRIIVQIPETSEKEKQNSLMQKSGGIISELIGSNLKTTDTETNFELNLAIMKIKHNIKRKQE